MSSTSKRRLTDFIKFFLKSSTTSIDNFDVQTCTTRVKGSKLNRGEQGISIFCSRKDCGLKAVRFIPDADMDEGTYTFALQTSLTNLTSRISVKLTAFEPIVLYEHKDELLMKNNEVLVLYVKTEKPVYGLIHVDYIPLVD